MQSAKVLTEDEITPSNLKKFFESIYLKANLTDHGHLIVQADDVLPVAITLDQHKKLLKLLFVYENDHGQRALKYVNYMNDTYNLARFTVSSSGKSIGVDYDLPYRGGINPYQLLSVLRIFTKVCVAALTEEESRIQEEDPGCVVPDRVLN
jgi:hypothetical protein